MAISKVLLVTDGPSGDEAIYVDGKKVFEDGTVYMVDVATHCRGLQCEIEHKSTYLETGEFPEDAINLKFEQL